MTQSISTTIEKQTRSELLFKALAFFLPITAVIVSCCISLFSKATTTIENPVVLMVASLFILLPLKTKNLSILQQITMFYLISVTANQLSAQYFSLGILPLDISCSSILLLLCTAGYFIEKFGSTDTVGNSKKTDIFNAWLLAIVIIVVHMIFLSVTLEHFYGYGHERNLSTIGNIVLYLLLFIVLRTRLSNLRFRQVIGLIMTIFYTVLILINR